MTKDNTDIIVALCANIRLLKGSSYNESLSMSLKRLTTITSRYYRSETNPLMIVLLYVLMTITQPNTKWMLMTYNDDLYVIGTYVSEGREVTKLLISTNLSTNKSLKDIELVPVCGTDVAMRIFNKWYGTENLAALTVPEPSTSRTDRILEKIGKEEYTHVLFDTRDSPTPILDQLPLSDIDRKIITGDIISYHIHNLLKTVFKKFPNPNNSCRRSTLSIPRSVFEDLNFVFM